MVIVRIVGGLASQLCKYVLGLSVAKLRKDILVLNIGDYLNGYFRPFLLEYLNLPDVMCISDISTVGKCKTVSNGTDLINEIKTILHTTIYIDKENQDYNEFYEEYWDSIYNTETRVFRDLNIKIQSQFLISFRNQIKNRFSVAVQIRRGDFVKLGLQNDINEYKSAIGHVKKSNANAYFFFFSNDISWVMQQFGACSDYFFIEDRTGYCSDAEDMFAISMCNLRILSSESGYGKIADLISQSKRSSDNSIIVGKMFNKNAFTRFCNKGMMFLNKNDKVEGLEYYHLFYSNNQPVSDKSNSFKLLTRREAINLSSNIDEKNCFWKRIYNVKCYRNRKIIIVSDEKIDLWRLSGDYLEAIMLARIGNKVLYIDLSKRINDDDYKISDENAYDMDGNCLGFRIVRCKTHNAIRIIKEFKDSDTVMVIHLGYTIRKHVYGIILRNRIKYEKMLSSIESEDELINISEERTKKQIIKLIQE